jgi:Holliday junction resolvase
MNGGRAPRRKGVRAERALASFLQAAGLRAQRVPLSGAVRGYPGDIVVPVLGVDRVVEVKVRSAGFQTFYKWLEGRDLLIIKADRSPPLVVVPLRLAVEVATAAAVGKVVGNDTKAEKAESFKQTMSDQDKKQETTIDATDLA